VEGLVFGETFPPIARLEAIRILLDFAASKGFKLYLSDGCEKCFPKWYHSGGSVC
jgi:hypothetical protein